MLDAQRLLVTIDQLIDDVTFEAAGRVEAWEKWAIRPEFKASVANLAAYLAIRHHDLRQTQRELMSLGLSSLGRLEGRVQATLLAVRSVLKILAGQGETPIVDTADFFEGERRLEDRSRALFGSPVADDRHVALLVTCPLEAAEDEGFLRQLALRGVEAIRINCAHDGPEAWMRMIANARAAEADCGHRFKIFMDLAGPKIRTGQIRARQAVKRLYPGDRIAMVPIGGLDRPVPADVAFTFECTLREALDAARSGHRLIIDDGKIVTRVDGVLDGTVIAMVERCKDEGAKLKPEKGINLPDCVLNVPALTAKDRDDLPFVAAHADAIGFSFVQHPDDVALLQNALAEVRPDWHKLALILKIETGQAVHNLPEIIVRAGARQETAVMIARGDLAIEIGFVRLAEMQEEILWIAEAAQVPVIWATQVLEHLVKEGMPNRGELTDAAMAARAECVMLNKGPHLVEAMDALAPVLGRMGGHMHKKTPQLRRLTSW